MTGSESLNERLSRYREITISVTGRKSGRTISIPIWFVLDQDTLYLLPVYGSDTEVAQACLCGSIRARSENPWLNPCVR